MNSVKDRYFATLVSGYALMVVQIVLTLVQVPLVLGYLGKEELGVWALATQVAIWLQMLDAGMNGAISRYLIDYRNQQDDGDLAKCVGTGFRIFCMQGVVVLVMTGLLGSFGQTWFGVGAGQAEVFQNALWLLGICACLGFVVKIVQAWYYASLRLDLGNSISLGLLLGEFVLFWFLLHAGLGVMALAWARLASSCCGVCLYTWIGIRKTGFPIRMLRSHWDRAMFSRLARFGGGMFLFMLGTQMLTMTQTILVTRHLGLAAAAVWVTAPRLFQVCQQVVVKLWDFRLPHLTSLMVAGETARIRAGFMGVFRLVALLGGGSLGVVVAVNPSFVRIWTHGIIEWEPCNDLLMASSVFVSLVIKCITDFVMHTKKIGWMPLLMCVEGAMFIGATMWLLPRYGMSGMLAALLAFGGVLRVSYAWGTFRTFMALDGTWIRWMLFQVACGLTLGILFWTLLIGVRQGLPRLDALPLLAIQSTLAATLLGLLSLRLFRAVQRV